MKKTKIIYRKINGKLTPEHLDVYYDMLSKIPEGGFVQADYSTVKKSKTQEQLGYLYGEVYPFIAYWFLETSGPVLYYKVRNNRKIPIKVSQESVDDYMKDEFAIASGEEFKKSLSNIDTMRAYIEFLDHYSFENFGQPLPPPKKKREEG